MIYRIEFDIRACGYLGQREDIAGWLAEHGVPTDKQAVVAFAVNPARGWRWCSAEVLTDLVYLSVWVEGDEDGELAMVLEAALCAGDADVDGVHWNKVFDQGSRLPIVGTVTGVHELAKDDADYDDDRQWRDEAQEAEATGAWCPVPDNQQESP